MSTKFSDIAVQYAKCGIKVFPCVPGTKKPLTRHGFKSATTNIGTIRRWWREAPDALIGGVCDGSFTVIDVDLKDGAKAFESLSKIFEFVNQSNSRVTTGSNGSHYYFKEDPEISRKIKVLPSVDILGVGGYAILPDDSRYLQTGSLEEFMGRISGDSFAEFPKKLKDHLLEVNEIEALTDFKVASKVSKTRSKSSEEVTQADESSDETNIKAVIDEKNSISGERIYEKSDNRKIRQFEYDGTPIKLEVGSLTTAAMNGLFYNAVIQKRLATHLGVPVPPKGGRSGSFKSLLATHTDKNPSMGTRWVGKGDQAYLVVRDFSDHHNDGKVDYNLVRLFAAQNYKASMTHLSGPLFCVWMLKLLHDANVIEVDVPEFDSEKYRMTKSEQKVSEGFLRLMAYKMLRKDIELETTFSQKFAAAWTGVSQSIVNSAKGKLIKFGNIVKTGSFVGVGMMRTAILRIGDSVVMRNEIRSIGELRFAIKMQIKKKMNRMGNNFRRLGKPMSDSPLNKNTTEEREDEYENRPRETGDPVSGFHCVRYGGRILE